AFTVACGGGILRDVCIGAIPPVGLRDWRYLAVALVAAFMGMGLIPLSRWVARPVLLFDALALSLFAGAGARKALEVGQNYHVARLVRVTPAVGGGVPRAALLRRVAVVFEREI